MVIARRRIKLELDSEDGDRLTLTFEGRLNREKLLQLADFLELYGGSDPTSQRHGNKLTKLMEVLEKHFPFNQFSTRDVVEAYRYEYREPIPLSTVSTYLARLAERGFLERLGTGNMARYRMLHGQERQVDAEGV
ncbi:MAG: BlaI/MecI/CopY family transcriptional regulator [Nitrososphaerota archaeon]